MSLPKYGVELDVNLFQPVYDPTKFHSNLLQFVASIEYFEGPILSTYKMGNELYLSKWCTCTEDRLTHRFLLTRINQDLIDDYVALRIPLLSLMLSISPEGFLVDYDNIMEHAATIRRIATVDLLNDLPEDYFPSPNAFHDPDLA